MQFFTPDLYQQFNSLDDVVAERANEAWEAAILAYKKHLEAIRSRMSSQVLALTELCLHDAEILARAEIVQANDPMFYPDFPFPISNWSAVAVITVQQGREILSLFYSLWDRVRTHDALETWSFSKGREHWLYDEVHTLDDRRGMTYTHQVLLSTGIVLEIPFLSVVMHRFSLPQVAEGLAKQSA